MKKKVYSMIYAGIMAMSLALAGCAPEEEIIENTSDAEKTIEFMHMWPEESAKQQNKIVTDIINQYEEKHPDINIKVEVLENEQYKNKIKVLSSSNDLPDVGMTWASGYLKPFVEGELLAPLDDVLEGSLKKLFISGTTEAYAIEGKTYGLPLELNIAPIYYNKEIFAEHNLEVPQTYDEFQHVVKKLADNGIAPIALGNKDRWTGSLWYMYLADRYGGPEVLTNTINHTGSSENAALTKAAQEIQKLVDENAFIKGFNGLSNEEGKSEFVSGKAAMYLMGSWELPNFTTNEEIPQKFRDNVGFFKFPTVKSGKGDINSWVGGPGVGLFVSEASDVKKESKEFLKFFIEKWGEQSVTGAGVIPATKVDTAAFVQLPDLYVELLNELNNASNITLFADIQMSASAAETHLNLIQSLFGEQLSPKEFTKQYEEALSKE